MFKSVSSNIIEANRLIELFIRDNIDLTRDKDILDYKSSKAKLLKKRFDKEISSVLDIERDVKRLRYEEIVKTFEFLRRAYQKKDLDDIKKLLLNLQLLLPEEKVEKREKIDIPKLPVEIKEELSADIREIRMCYDAGCYRSAVVLCGRVLEAALHRKYFEKTGNDILETNPSIGLGKLIAKLREQDVRFDPGITEQIHLINKARISSVHKKKHVFKPTKEQANAIMLYTMDVLRKLFK